MSMLGGLWGALLGLLGHYAFFFNPHEEFSFKWVFPVLIAGAGAIVSSALWKLDAAYHQLADLATRDTLTGLFNRRRLPEEFARLQHTARAANRPMLLVAWDLDDLKQVNDSQGHAAGDARIRAFAASLQAAVRGDAGARSADVAFRVGGDEFISLHLGAAEGGPLAARVLATRSAVSAGWVRCESMTLDQALTQADHALYANKQQRKASGGTPA
jgi:diguanylate cyclase (GGDEF)-like protein